LPVAKTTEFELMCMKKDDRYGGEAAKGLDRVQPRVRRLPPDP
jgi:hypothetical protein